MRCVGKKPTRLAPVFRSDTQLQILGATYLEPGRHFTIPSSWSGREFQRMRRRRNEAEYDDITIGRADLTADLAHTEAIIEAVRNAL